MKETITFCIPSKNNLRYLKSSINSIRKNSTLDNKIIVWVDANDDNTVEWLIVNKITHLINPDSKPQGIAAGYNRCIEAADTEIVCMFHADMFMGKGFDKNIIKHLQPGKVVCGTRIEPPLHPEGKEKIIKDFGLYPEDFNEEGFNTFVENVQISQLNQTTRGIFAPWACFKEDIVNIGLHDEYFHSYHEDSDIFNRFILNKMEIIQSRDALVYHLTCRGGKWIDGIEQVTQDPNFHNMAAKAQKHYIRKWGVWIKNDEYQYPILSPKYTIVLKVYNCSYEMLRMLEPWCDRIHIENQDILSKYVGDEQQNTCYDLKKRVFIFENISSSFENNIILEFDANMLTQESFNILTNISNIIKESGGIGEFELDIFRITIRSLESFEKDLIHNTAS